MKLWKNKWPINAVHLLYAKIERKYPAYVSKQNSKHDKRRIFLMKMHFYIFNALFFGFSRLWQKKFEKHKKYAK